jgi:hypothetical protein
MHEIERDNEPQQPQEEKNQLDTHLATALGKDLEQRFTPSLIQIEHAITELASMINPDEQSMFIEPMTEALEEIRKTNTKLQTKQPYFFEESPGRFKLRFNDLPLQEHTPPPSSSEIRGDTLTMLRIAFEDSYNNTLAVFMGYADIIQLQYGETISSDSTHTIISQTNEINEFINSLRTKEAIKIQITDEGTQMVTYIPKQETSA